jgi:hypothetical protein
MDEIPRLLRAICAIRDKLSTEYWEWLQLLSQQAKQERGERLPSSSKRALSEPDLDKTPLAEPSQTPVQHKLSRTGIDAPPRSSSQDTRESRTEESSATDTMNSKRRRKETLESSVNQDFNNNMNKGDRNKDGDEIA